MQRDKIKKRLTKTKIKKKAKKQKKRGINRRLSGKPDIVVIRTSLRYI